MCVLVHEWVYAAQVLDCFTVLLIPSIFCQDSKDVKLRTTKSPRAIDTEKDTTGKIISSNYVKLKWLNLQNDRVEWIFIFPLSSSVVTFLDVWENGTKTNFVKQSHSSPQSVHLCLLSCCSPANQKHWSLSPWRQKVWWRHQTSSQNSRLSESHSLVKGVFFTSKVNLTLGRVKVKWRFGFKMVWFFLLISLSSSLRQSKSFQLVRPVVWNKETHKMSLRD